MPPGTSKWNKIEHRLFSHISMNWRGRPLTSHDVIIDSIAATTTRTGLTVHAELDTGTYDTGIKVTDSDIDALPIHRHRFHGDWNYSLQPLDPTAPPRSKPHGRPASPARSLAPDICAVQNSPACPNPPWTNSSTNCPSHSRSYVSEPDPNNEEESDCVLEEQEARTS